MWNDNELFKMVEGGIPFPMLSDDSGKAGMVYGIYDSDAGGEAGKVWEAWRTSDAFDWTLCCSQ